MNSSYDVFICVKCAWTHLVCDDLVNACKWALARKFWRENISRTEEKKKKKKKHQATNVTSKYTFNRELYIHARARLSFVSILKFMANI